VAKNMMTLNIAADKQPFKLHENANLATFVKVQHDAIAE
jgi:hypothetical protein